MIYALWLILGFIAGYLLHFYARSKSARGELHVLAIALVIAAIIYVCFAILWGNVVWIAIELAGLPIYGLFAWAAVRHGQYYLLAIGWMLHPLWDVGLHLFGTGRLIAPEWYVVACVSFDLLVAGYIFYRMAYWQQQKLLYASSVESGS